MKKFYIVEHRDHTEPSQMTWDFAFLASSIEKAEEFIKKNQDYDKEDHNWWWAVYATLLDEDDFKKLKDNELRFYNKEGERVENQPY